MYTPVTKVSLQCDSCAKVLVDVAGNDGFEDEVKALDFATFCGWWCDGDGHHHCPACKKQAME